MADLQRAFVITRLGFNLIAKWGIGAERVIDSIWVGNGRYEEGANLALLEDLVSPIAQATSTVPQTIGQQIQFILEYRNDLEPSLDGFWLNEYGVFAIDPDVGRILLCYGSLGDKPEWVAPYSSGEFNRRAYPISIGVGSDAEITLSYPAAAFVTSEDLEAHNTSPTAHEALVNPPWTDTIRNLDPSTGEGEPFSGARVRKVGDIVQLHINTAIDPADPVIAQLPDPSGGSFAPIEMVFSGGLVSVGQSGVTFNSPVDGAVVSVSHGGATSPLQRGVIGVTGLPSSPSGSLWVHGLITWALPAAAQEVGAESG